jgi:hypothetical protein
MQRVLLAVDPHALEETGLLSAEQQLGHQQMFLAYSRAGWNGAGYGKRAISPALAATALNDNVPSVFLLNDFGIVGFAGLLVVLIGMCGVWLLARRNQNGNWTFPLDPGGMLSLASLVTWVYADLYMVLANCGVLLFTGKNVFLWSLNSASDLFHSMLVIGLMTYPLLRASEPSIEVALERAADTAPIPVGETA